MKSINNIKMRLIVGEYYEADLNQIRKIAGKKERVRLLYINTPELNESHKGQEHPHGLPEKKL